MPRKHRESKRRDEVTNELRTAMLDCDGRAGWERYWGGAAEGRAAFERLRYDPELRVGPEDSYETWCARELVSLADEPDPRLAGDDDDEVAELDFEHE